MGSNLLMNKIYLIQNEYKELLTTLLPILKSSHSQAALDEINLFWLRHSPEIQLYLRTWFPGTNSYVFTAVSYMDFEDKEYFPFLLMGDKHILDDPLSTYSEIQNKLPKGKNAELLYEQIGITAEDNLKLLENVSREIIILPLRLFNHSNNYNYIYKLGEQAFVSLFKGIDTLKDYFTKCNNIDDILHFARDDIGNLVIFPEDEDLTLPFEERFKFALTGTQYMLDENKTDSYNFFMIVFGYLQQAIDIIVSSLEYKCIPYIRSPVVFHYIDILSKCMLDIENMSTLRFKMSVAFITYLHCNKENLSLFGLKEFLRKKEIYRFNDNLFHTLKVHNIDKNNFFNHSIEDIVINELEKFYAVPSDTNYGN